MVPIVIGLAVGRVHAQQLVTAPIIAETASAMESFTPVASDGHRGHGFLRKPPGSGRFPAVLMLHPGNTEQPDTVLRPYASTGVLFSRFLAAGYVTAVATYRSRDVDPQTTDARDDALAALEELRSRPYVEPASVVVYGCSGGGDLALEVAAKADLAAVAVEEPATVMFTGAFNSRSTKAGERFTPADSIPILDNPSQHYTAERQEMTRGKVRNIHAPVLFIQGNDRGVANRWNDQTILPELRNAGVNVSVRTFAGEPHCFAWGPMIPGGLASTPHPEVAQQAFEVADEFFRRHVKACHTRLMACL